MKLLKLNSIILYFNKFIKFVKQNNDLKIWLVVLSVICTFIIFKDDFAKLIGVYLASIFDNAEFPILFEIIYGLLISFFLLYSLIKIFSGFIENRLKLIGSITIGLVYSYFRYFDLSFEFNVFSFSKRIAYLDIITFNAILSFFALIINYFKLFFIKKEKLIDDIFDDSPWMPEKQDELNRYEAAKRVCEKINEFDISKSYSIGIIGTWGEGKTSFLNMIKHELKKDKNSILIEFNPWKNIDFKHLQKDFFTTLKGGLSSFSSEILPELNRYIKILFQYDKSKISTLVSSFIQEQNQISTEFDNVNKAIKKINKKIIICIDDIDRLHYKEIIEVIKVVRNTGNFSNTIFIAAYDKNYVNKALKKFTKYKNDLFLEKIFQQEIILPSYPQSILANKFIKYLREYYKSDINLTSEIELKIKFRPEDYSLILGWTGEFSEYASVFLDNLRDVKRLTNSFIHSFSPIKEEVEIIDFLHLEILKLKAYPIYESIKQREILKLNENNWSAYKFEEIKFKEFYDSSKMYKTAVEDILTKLFPERPDNKDPRSICFQKSFSSYFSNQIFYRLSRGEFNKLFGLDEAQLQKKLSEWLEKRYLNDILEYLSTIPKTSFSDRSEFVNYLEVWFWLIEKGHEINIDHFISLFKEENKTKYAEQYFGGNSKDLDDLFKEFISNANKPYHIRKVIYKLIADYQYNSNYDFLVSEEELKTLALNYLEKFLKSENELTEDGMRLYYTCIDKISKSDHKIHLLDKASQMIKEYIENHPTYYLDNFIRPFYIEDKHNMTGEPFAPTIFESYDGFKKFLKSQKDYPKIKILQSFFEKYEKNNFEPVYYENPEKDLKELCPASARSENKY